MDVTPHTVIAETQRLQAELDRAPDIVYRAEVKLAELEAELDRIESLAFLNAEGSNIAKCQALAKIESLEARKQRNLARAELNRVKMRTEVLKSALVSTSVIGKQVEMMWRQA